MSDVTALEEGQRGGSGCCRGHYSRTVFMLLLLTRPTESTAAAALLLPFAAAGTTNLGARDDTW